MMHKNIKVFTLIELLIVLAIFLLISALLWPALKKTMNIAFSIECQGQLKQLGVATSLYTNDFNELLPNPIVRVTPTADDDGRWTNVMREYIIDKEILYCEIAPDNIKNIYSPKALSGNQWFGKPSYGFNMFLYLRSPLFGFNTLNQNEYSHLSLNQILSTSECVLFGDTNNPQEGSVNSQYLFPYKGPTPVSYGGILSDRHDFGGNFLWADMHVDNQDREIAFSNVFKWFGPKGK